MTILWCGGEDVDTFYYDGSSTYTYCDESFARIGSKGGVYYNKFTPITSGWVSAICCVDTWAGCRLFGLRDSVTGAILGVGQGTSASRLQLFKQGATKVVLTEETSGVLPSNSVGTANKIDIHLVSYGVSGQVLVYVNGNLAIDYSGDLTSLSASGFDHVARLKDSGSTISEIIVADEDTRLMRLKTLAPSAAGDANDWTGTYEDVDETSIYDSDKIYSATDNTDFQCNLTGMPSGTWSVKAVKVAVRCVDSSGSTGIQLGIKSGGTVDVGDTQTASGYWQTKERLMTVNPVTGVAFTPAEIEALQINLRAKAL